MLNKLTEIWTEFCLKEGIELKSADEVDSANPEQIEFIQRFIDFWDAVQEAESRHAKN